MILVLSLMSFNAFADTVQCTSILNSMTDLTNSYITVLKSCRELENQGETSSRFYEGYRRIARSVETTHSKATAECYNVCDDTSFCEGELSGACLK